MTDESTINPNAPVAYSSTGDGNVTVQGSESYTAGREAFEAGQPGAILATAHDGLRSLQPHEVRKGVQVRLPNGMSTEVSVAAHLGFLKANADGTYSEVTSEGFSAAMTAATAPRAETDVPQMPEELPFESLGKHAEDLLAIADGAADQGAVMAGLVSAVNETEMAPEVLGRLATAVGKEPAEVLAGMDTLREAYAGQAGRYVAGMVGEDGYEGFYAWANQHRQGQLREAMKRHVLTGRMEAYQPLAKAYVGETLRGRNNPLLHELIAANPALRPQWREDRVVIHHPAHGQIELSQAIAAGIIRRTK